jgi:hypothetical protein
MRYRYVGKTTLGLKKQEQTARPFLFFLGEFLKRYVVIGTPIFTLLNRVEVLAFRAITIPLNIFSRPLT